MRRSRFHCYLLVAALAIPTVRAIAAEEAEADTTGAKKLEVSRLKPAVLTFAGLTKITIHNSDIATAMILSDDRVAIEGRSAGTTTVELFRMEGDKETSETIEVTVLGAKEEEATTVEAKDEAKDETGTPPPTKDDSTAGATPPVADQGAKPAEDTTRAATTDPTPVNTEPERVTPDETTQPPETDNAETTPDTGTAETNVTAEEIVDDTTPPKDGDTKTEPVEKATQPEAESKPVLWLSMSVERDEGEAGVLSYAVTVGNRGAVEATDVIVRDVLPPEVVYVEGSATESGQYNEVTRELEWRIPSVKGGEELSGRLSFQARLADGVSSSATIHNVATCECKELDTMVASNTASHTVQSSSLVAIFALPDVVLARKPLSTPLVDVRGEEYRAAVDRLEGLGIVHGYPDRTFLPDANVNRAESTKMVVLAANLKEFRDRTRLTYVLGREATVTVKIMSDAGECVRTLANGEKEVAGDHALTWDGLSDNGVPVPAGTYQYQATAVDADEQTTTLKTTLTVVAVKDTDLKGAPTFKDIVPTDWYAGYIAEAENRQYVRGYPDGTFGPRRSLTRAEATAIVVRALGMEKDAQARMGDDVGFLDQEEIPGWASGYIAVASTEAPKAGGQLIIGYPGNTFQPRNAIKRTEAAAMIERFVDRDVPTEATVAGAVSPGASITLNGNVVQGDAHGRFRERISLTADGTNTIAVLMK